MVGMGWFFRAGLMRGMAFHLFPFAGYLPFQHEKKGGET